MGYDKECGNIRLVVSEPSPRWVRISHRFQGQDMHGLQMEDLRDLRHLIDRALELCA